MRIIIADFVTLSLLVACGSQQTTASLSQPNRPGASASPTLTRPSSTNEAQLCDELTWPRPVPAIVGTVIGDAGALLCWDDVRAIAPDGHDPVNQPNDSDKGIAYRITDISPAPGTPAGRKDVITAHVVPEALLAAQPAFYPCNWVTADEAASFFADSSTTVDPTGDELGAAAPFCTYNSGSHFVTSQLQLPAYFPVDAQTQLGLSIARGHGNEVGGLPGRAYCSTSESDNKKSTTLQVLLSGNRLYQAMGWKSESCNTLKQFAQTAIPRIDQAG
jgi:hypothetical protein